MKSFNTICDNILNESDSSNQSDYASFQRKLDERQKELDRDSARLVKAASNISKLQGMYNQLIEDVKNDEGIVSIEIIDDTDLLIKFTKENKFTENQAKAYIKKYIDLSFGNSSLKGNGKTGNWWRMGVTVSFLSALK